MRRIQGKKMKGSTKRQTSLVPFKLNLNMEKSAYSLICSKIVMGSGLGCSGCRVPAWAAAGAADARPLIGIVVWD
jgi:hypothetical protein